MAGFSMAGRVALVTGASGTLGRHFAAVLLEAGARVVLAARRLDVIEAEAERLGEAAMAVPLDVTGADSVEAALTAAERRFGVCDVLINNAGIAVTRPALDVAIADWDGVVDVNLRGPFLMAQAVARRLIAAKQPGTIVNVASILGERVIAGVSSYAASKAALLHLTRSLAIEWARHRIRVNALAPGYVATDINRSFFETEPGQALIRRIPQRRLGALDDLTGPLLLLASDAGAHMTGSTLTVDGGHSTAAL